MTRSKSKSNKTSDKGTIKTSRGNEICVSDRGVDEMFISGIKTVEIEALRPDGRNANKGTERGRQALADSLKKYGAGRSILIDKRGAIIGGNKTIEQAQAAGIKNVVVVETDGSQIVAVKRTDLDLERDAKARELAYADNRSGQLNLDWDANMIMEDIDLGFEIPGFNPQEIEKILRGALDNSYPNDIDAIQLLPQNSESKFGEVYELGRHRLMCGDSTNANDVKKLLADTKPILMTTDPPYGVRYDSSWRAEYSSGDYSVGTIQNDDIVDWSLVWSLWDVPILYVWHSGLHADIVSNGLKNTNYELRAQIIWNKSVMVFGRGHYHWKHESCWYAVKKGHTANWFGDRSQCTVWDYGNGSGAGRTGDQTDDFHANHISQKPVELFRIPILNHTKRKDVVCDPFGGSGSCLIACEVTERTCYMMEIDPLYCDVIRKRYAELMK